MKIHTNSFKSTAIFILFLFSFTCIINCVSKVATLVNKNQDQGKMKINETLNSESKIKKQINLRPRCEYGFGFKGICLKDIIGLTSTEIPNSIKDYWPQIVTPILSKISKVLPFNSCIGDFSSKVLSYTNGELSDFVCDVIPFYTTSTDDFGTIGLRVSQLPCGEPTAIRMCVAFDRCGTIGIAVNGGSLKCFLHATGIGGIVAEGAKYLDYVSFGISPKRKFSQTISIGEYDGREINYKKVTAYGHFFAGIGVALPPSLLKIEGMKLDEILEIKMNTQVLVDFGQADSLVKEIASSITNGTSKGIMNKIVELGAEMSFTAKTSVGIKLEDLTKGFLPDIELEIGELNILITTGKGSTGIDAGFYARLSANIVKNLMKILKVLDKHFNGVLNALGGVLQVISDATGITGAISVNMKAIALEFKSEIVHISCYFLFTGKASCKFGSQLFTALLESAKWVIKKAEEFFEEGGKTIMKVTAKAGKFMEDVDDQAKDIAKDALKEAKKAAKKIKDAAEDAKDKIEDAFSGW